MKEMSIGSIDITFEGHPGYSVEQISRRLGKDIRHCMNNIESISNLSGELRIEHLNLDDLRIKRHEHPRQISMKIASSLTDSIVSHLYSRNQEGEK